jgi:copper chaperone CopZ
MRKILAAFAASLLLSTASLPAALACEGHDKVASEKKAPAPAHVATASFRVEGMHCDGCADKVKNGLAATTGIVEVVVSVADKRVTVKYDSDRLDVAKVAKLIGDLGYKAAAEA